MFKVYSKSQILCTSLLLIFLPFIVFYSLNISFHELILYSLFSLARMTIAYLFGLLIAIVLELIVFKNERILKIVFPILDVLQSVPILGFVPAALLVIRSLAPGRIGTEMVAIFLIFTSQAWALMYAALEAFSSLPHDLVELKNSFKISDFTFISKVLLPFSFPYFVAGSVLAFGGGWYFLMAAESFSLGSEQVNLPGLGTFLFQSAYSGNLQAYFIGLITLMAIVVIIHEFIWSPLEDFSKTFRYEFVVEESIFRRNFTVIFLGKVYRVIVYISSCIYKIRTFLVQKIPQLKKFRSIFMKVSISIFLVFLLYLTLSLFVHTIENINILIKLASYYNVFFDAIICMLSSFFRVLLAYILTVSIVIPVGLITAKTKLKKFLLPFFDIMQSTPAIAFFPILIKLVISRLGESSFSINLISLVLTMTGMIWYLLFNVVISLSNIPSDIEEMLKSFNVSSLKKISKIYLPASFAGVLYGSIQAFGGGYNALVVSEYIVFGSKVYSVEGIGSFLNIYSDAGDVFGLTIGLVVFIVFIVLFNKLVWSPLTDKAKKFRFGE